MSTLYQQINLYQPLFRKQRQIFAASTMLQALGAVAAVLLGIYAFGFAQVKALELEVTQLEARERALTMELARIDPGFGQKRRAAVAVELAELNATLVDRHRLIEVLRDDPVGAARGFSDYLAALGRQRTPELWLTEFAINGSTGAMQLAGRATRPELIPEYMQRLGSESALAGQEFDRFEIEHDEPTGGVRFRATSRAAMVVLASADGARRQ